MPFTGLKLVGPPANVRAFRQPAAVGAAEVRRAGQPGHHLSATITLRALHQATNRVPRRLLGLPEPGSAAA